METKKGDEERQLKCCLPEIPPRPLDVDIDPNRESLIRYVEKKWANHTVLHYYFLDAPEEWRGSDTQKQGVRDSFTAWKELSIGLEFREVADPNEAEIRIGFETGGSWSYVGRDCIDLVPNPRERTTNFGWDLTTPHGRDTALHEIGHALGFPHEHQNPHAGIVWNEEAVFSYFEGPPNNWSRSKTHYNVIRKISPTEVHGSQWDKDSIMHYAFNAGLIVVPEEYKTQSLIPDSGLSPVDINEVQKFYPKDDEVSILELKPFSSQSIQIDPGEQLNFAIHPAISKRYVIQTFGSSDTVMVLFEDVDGEPVFLAGDDDSGTDLNAQISIRLLRGRTYYLRIRLYFASVTGEGAVMLW